MKPQASEAYLQTEKYVYEELVVQKHSSGFLNNPSAIELIFYLLSCTKRSFYNGHISIF